MKSRAENLHAREIRAKENRVGEDCAEARRTSAKRWSCGFDGCFGRALGAESLKLRRDPLWLAFVALPLLGTLLGAANFCGNRRLLGDSWEGLWSQLTLFDCYIFLPVLLAICCASLWRMEHERHNWNLVLTQPVPVVWLYAAKLFFAGVLLALTQLWTGLLFLAAGCVCGVTAPFPWTMVCGWLGWGWLGGMVACALQLLLSLWCRSFALPVGLAFFGGVAGLAFFIKGWALYDPYALLALGMRANGTASVATYGNSLFLVFSLGYIALFVLLTVLTLLRGQLADGE